MTLERETWCSVLRSPKFMNEVRLTLGLDAPHIPGWCSWDDDVYVVMSGVTGLVTGFPLSRESVTNVRDTQPRVHINYAAESGTRGLMQRCTNIIRGEKNSKIPHSLSSTFKHSYYECAACSVLILGNLQLGMQRVNRFYCSGVSRNSFSIIVPLPLL